MSWNWADASEVVAGRIFLGKLNRKFVNVRKLIYPYDDAIKLLQDVEGSDISDVMFKIGVDPVETARRAADTVPDDMDCLAILDMAYNREQLIDQLKGMIRTMERGQDADVGKLMSILNSQRNYGGLYVTLDKVDPAAGVWTKTGYAPLDKYMGGLPDPQLTVMAGSPGVGKTSLAIEIACEYAKSKRKVLMYTFEMVLVHIVHRLLEIRDDMTLEDRKYILATEQKMNVDEVYADASRLVAQEDIELVVIDFADLMSKTETTESDVAHIYKTLAELSTQAKVPVILVAQLNRASYEGGIPRVNHIRWSGMAEACAGMIILLYNPDRTFVGTGKADDRLPYVPGRGYIIIGKSRFGYGDEGTPGGIQVEWDSDNGSWGRVPLSWHPLTQA